MSHKFHKIANFFSFEVLKKKFGPIFKELLNFLPKKLSICSQKLEPDIISGEFEGSYRDRSRDFFMLCVVKPRLIDPRLHKAFTGTVTVPVHALSVRNIISLKNLWNDIRQIWSHNFFAQLLKIFMSSTVKNTEYTYCTIKRRKVLRSSCCFRSLIFLVREVLRVKPMMKALWRCHNVPLPTL